MLSIFSFVTVVIQLLSSHLTAQSSTVLPPAYQANLRIASASVQGDDLIILRAEDKVITRKIGAADPEGFIDIVKTKVLKHEIDRDGGAVVRYEQVFEVPVRVTVKDEKTGKDVIRTQLKKEKRTISRRLRNQGGKKIVLYRDWVQTTRVTESDGSGGIVNFRTRDNQRSLIKAIEHDEELIRCRVASRSKCKLREAECYAIHGIPLDENQVRKKLAERRPVILLSGKWKTLDPFYEQILDSKMILIYLKQDESP